MVCLASTALVKHPDADAYYLEKPTPGQIIWDGEDIFAMDGRYRNLLGYLLRILGTIQTFPSTTT